YSGFDYAIRGFAADDEATPIVCRLSKVTLDDIEPNKEKTVIDNLLHHIIECLEKEIVLNDKWAENDVFLLDFNRNTQSYQITNLPHLNGVDLDDRKHVLWRKKFGKHVELKKLTDNY
ncbi:hypothetical protein RFI_06705, partial [Reticulomyxa filosa]